MNLNSELIFGTLAISTTAASSALKYYQHEYFYTFPLYYDSEYAWYNLGVYMLGLWSLYSVVWFIYFFVGDLVLFEAIWELLVLTSPIF